MPIKTILYQLSRAWFVSTFVFSLALTSLFTRLVHLMYFLSKRRRHQLSSQLAGLGFRAIFALNPQISVEHVGEDEPAWDQLFADEDNKPLILVNHTSQLDSLFYSACVPLQQIRHMRTLAKSSLFNLPVFGWLLKACGHFPVFFAKDSAMNDFSVDKVAQEKVQLEIEKHVQEGGGLTLFPEGQINRLNSRQLQSFRRGSLQMGKKNKMVIWGFLHTGVDTVWPVNAALGGFPAKIRFKLFKVPTKPDTEEIAEYVTHIEAIMQLELDLMHAIDEGKSVDEIEKRRSDLMAEVKIAAAGDAKVEKELAKAVDMTTR